MNIEQRPTDKVLVMPSIEELLKRFEKLAGVGFKPKGKNSKSKNSKSKNSKSKPKK